MTAEPAPPFHVCAILGMHRSGTSWLAGSLEEAGLALGEVSASNPHNLKGNRENPALNELHEAVLRDNDRSWKRPGVPNRWSAERTAALAEHIGAMDARFGSWGFKDPRALLLFDEWRRQIPEGLVRVGVYRHPLSVHQSLTRRNPRFTEGRSAKIWKAYNESLIAEHGRDPFPILRFDVDPAQLLARLDSIVRALALPGAEKASEFFDQGLVHNAEAAARKVPWSCRKVWAYLEDHAE